MPLLFLLALAVPAVVSAQTGQNVLIVENRNDAVSRQIVEYYRPRRSVPAENVCAIAVTPDEEIDWNTYQQQIERPVGDCLRKAGLQEKVLYIVTTMGIPLKVKGGGRGLSAEYASVDSELALLYGKLKGARVDRAGGVPNPFFMKRDTPFRHPDFPMYLVTRLAAGDWNDVKGMIDRSLAARNRGVFVIDLNGTENEEGNNSLRTAALLLPLDRVVLDESDTVLYGAKGVIGFASWGSNDPNRKKRMLGFSWLPGAIATEFVSTNARTMKRPPDNWTYTTWADHAHHFADSPQGLSTDLLHEGATGATGNVYEPFLIGCARPDYLFPAYVKGRNLAESYYLSIRWLSWQGVMLGDPLCALGK
jgi:uncharacterized protein (TIGR03790 family)